MPDDDFESRKSFLVAFLRSVFKREGHQASLFFSIKKIKLLEKVVWVREASQYAKDCVVEGRDHTSIRRMTAKLM